MSTDSSGLPPVPPVPAEPVRPLPRWKRITGWMRSHPIKAFLLAILLFIVYELATIPFFGVPRLATVNPTETALMQQRVAEAKSEGKSLTISQRWVPLSKIPKHVIDAIIVAEDGTFYTHHGFDWYEVQESINKNIKEKRAARGASTITQQLAKNLYLSTSKDPLRKAKEALITMLLEHYLSKQRILELYLNLIEWGKGVFGIEMAARTYFGKPASALTLEEATRLAAVIPSPLKHRPDADSRYVMRRKEIVMRRMNARWGTTEAAADTAEEIPFPQDSTQNGETE